MNILLDLARLRLNRADDLTLGDRTTLIRDDLTANDGRPSNPRPQAEPRYDANGDRVYSLRWNPRSGPRVGTDLNRARTNRRRSRRRA